MYAPDLSEARCIPMLGSEQIRLMPHGEVDGEPDSDRPDRHHCGQDHRERRPIVHRIGDNGHARGEGKPWATRAAFWPPLAPTLDCAPARLSIQPNMLINQHYGDLRRRARLAALATFAFASVAAPAAGQTSDSAYRKFDGVLAFIRQRNAKQYAITSPSGIDEASYVQIGGIDQWITIRGQDRANPVLLIVHGGPGDPTNPWTFRIFAPWEEKFTVVQWDERGAGRTLAKSGPGIASTLTVDRMAQDGIELAAYLCQHLGKPKVIVLAHSFGTLLAMQMVHQRPDLFYAYVGTGQVADETRNYAVAYDALLQKARALGNSQAVSELQRVGPPPYTTGDGYRVQWKWANAFEGADEFLNGRVGVALVAPGGSIEDFDHEVEGEGLSADQLVGQTKSKRMEDFGLTYALPVFFFQGAEDFTAPTALAREYLDRLQAPQKAFVAIPGGGHFAMFMRSDAFLAELLERVRPLAVDK
jgi:pimeloyl-ACP methyl ester carboxylesterase